MASKFAEKTQKISIQIHSHSYHKLCTSLSTFNLGETGICSIKCTKNCKKSVNWIAITVYQVSSGGINSLT